MISARHIAWLAGAFATAIAVVGVVVVVRYDQAHPREVQPMQAHGTALDLRCRVDVDGGKAMVRFSVTNKSEEEVYLYDGGASPEAELVCDAGDGAANVLLGIPPLPPGRSFVWKFHPETTLLRPGQRKEGAFTLDLPLREWGAYDNDDYLSLRTIHVDRLRLLLDYLRPSSAGFTPAPQPVGTPECAVCEVSVDLSLERRDDAFERRGTTVR